MRELVSQALRPEVGIVGARLALPRWQGPARRDHPAGWTAAPSVPPQRRGGDSGRSVSLFSPGQYRPSLVPVSLCASPSSRRSAVSTKPWRYRSATWTSASASPSAATESSARRSRSSTITSRRRADTRTLPRSASGWPGSSRCSAVAGERDCAATATPTRTCSSHGMRPVGGACLVQPSVALCGGSHLGRAVAPSVRWRAVYSDACGGGPPPSSPNPLFSSAWYVAAYPEVASYRLGPYQSLPAAWGRRGTQAESTLRHALVSRALSRCGRERHESPRPLPATRRVGGSRPEPRLQHPRVPRGTPRCSGNRREPPAPLPPAGRAADRC